MNTPSDTVRLDKWLWSVRIYKTRSMAAEACRKGHVSMNGKKLKPAWMLASGEMLEVKKNGFNMSFFVKSLISKRVSASLAQECYEDRTPQEELDKYKSWFIGKARPEIREKGVGRPTKKERRVIDDFKDELFVEDE